MENGANGKVFVTVRPVQLGFALAAGCIHLMERHASSVRPSASVAKEG
jgi:hypothetical protein